MEILNDIHLIKCPFMTSPWFTTVVAVMNDTVALVDTGTPGSPQDAIFPFLRNARRNIEDISQIVISHGHYDHCGGVHSIKRISGAKVIIHSADKGLIEDPYLMKRSLLARFPNLSFDGIISDEEPPFEPIFAGKVVQDGERLRLSNYEFEVLHIPGHSAGTICLAEKKIGLYIVGDGVQGRGERRPLIFHGATDYIESLERLKNEHVNYLILGHPFPPFGEAVLQDDRARTYIDESLLAIEELASKVLGILSKENRRLTIREIRRGIPMYSEISIGCILEKLSMEGKVRETRQNGDLFWNLV